MVAYRLPLLLLTCLTCSGFLSSPNPSAISKNFGGPEPSGVSDEPAPSLLLAQENSILKKLRRKLPPRLPVGTILLGVGSVVVTGGAVFIIFRLIGYNPEPQEEEKLPEDSAPVEESSVQFVPSENALIPPSSLSPFQLEDAEDPPETAHPPTRKPPEEPAKNNGYVDAPRPKNQPPKKAPVRPQVQPAETFLLPEQPRLPQLDRVEQLILELQNPDPAKRSQTIWELGQKGDSRAIQPLVDLIYNSDSKQRSLILSALSEIGTRTLKPMGRALALSLQDENAEVRKNAIRDLTRIYDLACQMNQLLQRAADDPDSEVRETARWAADKLSRMRPLPTINDEPPR